MEAELAFINFDELMTHIETIVSNSETFTWLGTKGPVRFVRQLTRFWHNPVRLPF